MPEFKNSGTGYTEHKTGSDQFPAKDTPLHKADPPTEGRKEERPNPNPQGGPQVY